MPQKADVALLGTGLAPLVAANHLLAHGLSPIVLNPDWDFFREDSELGLDPFWPIQGEVLSPQRILRSTPDHVIGQLRPDFPGAVELWNAPSGQHPIAPQKGEFQDSQAPYVRSRSRLWVQSERTAESLLHPWDWNTIEEMYVETSDAGLHPQAIDGLMVARRFPGFAGPGLESMRAVLVPKICDVDVGRYRTGLLEYVREKLGTEGVRTAVTQLEAIDGGVRFHSDGAPHTVEAKALLVFWTPRMSQWIEKNFNPLLKKESGARHHEPGGVRVWEEWTLLSRDPVDAGTVGVFEGMVVSAEHVGAPPDKAPHYSRLAVLRPGPKIAIEEFRSGKPGLSWASGESFSAVDVLCREFLGWERFTVCSMRPRVLMEWNPSALEMFKDAIISTVRKNELVIDLVAPADGPVFDVVEIARKAAERYV